jgi:hypothetical protein
MTVAVRLRWLLVPAGLIVLALVAVPLATGRRSSVAAAGPLPAHSSAAVATFSGPPGFLPAPDPQAGPPTRLKVPAIGVDTSLESLTLDAAGVLTPPITYDRAGWFSQGVRPGDEGPAVLAGHVNSQAGPAVFWRLHDLKPGARIEVDRGATTIFFRVVATERYAKDAFPSKRVYGPTPGPELRLITCGGVFDRAKRSYVDNIVVYAIIDGS